MVIYLSNGSSSVREEKSKVHYNDVVLILLTAVINTRQRAEFCRWGTRNTFDVGFAVDIETKKSDQPSVGKEVQVHSQQFFTG